MLRRLYFTAHFRRLLVLTKLPQTEISSQQRGPKAGELYEKTLSETSRQSINKPEIFVLEGGAGWREHIIEMDLMCTGFVNWHGKGFARDGRLTEEYDEDHWKDGYQG